MASEFDLIRRFFERPARDGSRTLLGVGDDAALVRVEPGMALAVSTDMLLAGRHFPGRDAAPRALGHKALAVNLSDLAAMGATPRWATLSDRAARGRRSVAGRVRAGLFALAGRFDVDLVGGDTTRGPLAISVTVLGEVPAAHALTRGGARPGDDIWVSGVLGQAARRSRAARAAAARSRRGAARAYASRHARATRRARRAPARRRERGDRRLGRISPPTSVTCSSARASARSCTTRSCRGERSGDAALDARCALAGGDDYELVFTAAQSERTAIAVARDRHSGLR